MKVELGSDFGRKMQAAIDKIVNDLHTATSVEIGWHKEATYTSKGGLPVAQVAATNEYGGTVTIPEHETFIYREANASLTGFNRGGKFVRASQSNFQTSHIVPEHTITIPARPFFRGMIAKEKPELPALMMKCIREADYDMSRALGLVGEGYVSKLQEAIRDFDDPANAPSTIARKGFDNPLIDTGHMERSVDHKVI